MSAPLDGKARTGKIYACYLVLVFLAPLPFGSNRPWAWTMLELVIVLIAAAWLLAYRQGRATRTAAFKLARPALVCAAIWVAYIWLQLLPLPPSVLHVLSPESAHWHAVACPASTHCYPSLTVDADATYDGALKSTAYMLFFALSLLLLDNRGRVISIGTTLVLSGLTQATYGALTALSSGIPTDASGSFANRNHFAAYLVMCLSVGIGLLIAGVKRSNSSSVRQVMRHTLRWILSPLMMIRIALAIMVIALVLTHSRMGNISFFLSLVVAGLTYIALARSLTVPAILMLASLVVVDIVIAGSYFGIDRVVERIEETNSTSEDRGRIADSTFAIWRNYPTFGTGLGSFRMVFPRYRTREIAVPHTHAHDDYLEFASETGIVGILLMGSLVLSSLSAAIRAQIVRGDPLMRGMSFAAIMGVFAMALHSAVDFNLQIPANALTFLLVLALGWISLGQGREIEP